MGPELRLKLGEDGLGGRAERKRRCGQNVKALNARQEVGTIPFPTPQTGEDSDTMIHIFFFSLSWATKNLFRNLFPSLLCDLG